MSYRFLLGLIFDWALMKSRESAESESLEPSLGEYLKLSVRTLFTFLVWLALLRLSVSFSCEGLFWGIRSSSTMEPVTVFLF